MSAVRMFVNGQAMSGGSLSDALAGGRFLGAANTAPRYRFFSVRDEFPGLFRVADGGVPIPGSCTRSATTCCVITCCRASPSNWSWA